MENILQFSWSGLTLAICVQFLQLEFNIVFVYNSIFKLTEFHTFVFRTYPPAKKYKRVKAINMNMSNFNRKSQLSWEKTQTVDRKGKKNIMLALSKQQN